MTPPTLFCGLSTKLGSLTTRFAPSLALNAKISFVCAFPCMTDDSG